MLFGSIAPLCSKCSCASSRVRTRFVRASSSITAPSEFSVAFTRARSANELVEALTRLLTFANPLSGESKMYRRAARSVSGVYGAQMSFCLMNEDVFSICCKVGRWAPAADPTCPTSTYASGCTVRQHLENMYLANKQSSIETMNSIQIRNCCTAFVSGRQCHAS